MSRDSGFTISAWLGVLEEQFLERILGMMSNVVTVSREDFEEFVARALEDIPTELRSAMDNVVVLVDDESPAGRLFGLYQGIPLTNRGGYSASMPDRITIFKATICSACESRGAVARQVHQTVLHEVGHHFGMSDSRLRELGW